MTYAGTPDDGRNWKGTRRAPPQDLESWFRRRLARLVAAGIPQWSPPGQARVVDWLVEHDADVLVWCDDEEYKGRFYARGWWTVDAKQVAALLPTATRAVALAVEAENYPTIESWLAALHAGEITTTPAQEPAGAGMLSEGATTRRRCRACGARFELESRFRVAKTCPPCRAAKREQKLRAEWGGEALRALMTRAGHTDESVAKAATEQGGLIVIPWDVARWCRGGKRRLDRAAERLARILDLPSGEVLLAFYRPEREWPKEHEAAMWGLLRELGLADDTEAPARPPATADSSESEG